MMQALNDYQYPACFDWSCVYMIHQSGGVCEGQGIGYILKANVRVNDQEGAENRVSDWVKRTSGERCNGQRNESCGDDSAYDN